MLATERSIVLEGLSHADAIYARYDVSQNGTLVYGTGGASPGGGNRLRLVTVGLDGTVEVENLDPRAVQRPVWSPDGRFVAYAGGEPGQNVGGGDRQIFTYDMVVKSRPRRLTSQGNKVWPAWSPDGTRIAFGSTREGTEDLDIFVKSVADDAPERLLWRAPGPQWAAHWFAEDRILIGNTGDEEPWILELTAGASGDSVARAAPFFESEASHEAALLSPQGDLVVYNSNDSGTWEVYVRSYPVPRSPEKISEGGGDYPHWSADGNAIYYAHGGDSLRVARIDRGPPFAVLDRAPLLPWSYSLAYDLHPDGDRFLTTQGADEADAAVGGRAPARHFVVTNWFEELRVRTGGAGRR